MKSFYRLLAAVMSAVMLAGILPGAVSADEEYPQGETVYTIFDDTRNGWGNATPVYVSMIEAPDTTEKKEGSASQRIKIGGTGYVNTGDTLYASIVNNSIPANIKTAVQEAKYLAFWYQPLLKREKIEVGFAGGRVGGGENYYAMLRVNMLDYMTIEDNEWGTNVWKLVKIPIADFFDQSKAILDANGTDFTEFDWNQLVGFSIATSDEGNLTGQPNFCRLDEVKIIGGESGDIEPDKPEEKYPEGTVQYTFIDDTRNGWVHSGPYFSAIDSLYNVAKEGTASQRMKVGGTGYVSTGAMLYGSIVNSAISAEQKKAIKNAQYLAFWYQPMFKREKIEVGFVCGDVAGGNYSYAMLRVNMLDYVTIEDNEWGTDIWKLAKIPMKDFFDSAKMNFDANGTNFSEFDWDRFAGFCIAVSDEGDITGQPNLCLLDELKVIGEGQGIEPSASVKPTAEPGGPTATPPVSTSTAVPTREPIEPDQMPQAKGETEQLFFDDDKVGWSVAYTDSQGRANYISEIVDKTVSKNGAASYRLKVATPYYTNTDLSNLEMLYCDIVNNPTTCSPDKANTYLEFWYQPLNQRERVEVGFACGSGKPYAMLRVNLMDYVTITQYGSNAPWQLVRIPMSDFKDESKTVFYRNNSSHSSFDWTRFAGFSIAASDENLNGQMEYCRLDDIRIVRYIGAPGALEVTDRSYDQITLEWNTPGEAVDGYYIYRDGVHVGTTSDLTFTDTGLQGNRMYTYWVQAYKGAAESEAVSVDAVTDGYFSQKPGTGVFFENIRYTANGETLSDYIIRPGTLNFNASIGVEQIDSPVYAVAAIYSENVMKDCKIQEITPNQTGNRASFEGQFTVESTQEHIDIFVVDSLRQLRAMTGCYRLGSGAYQILDGIKNPASVNRVKASYSPRTKRISVDLGVCAGTAIAAVVAADTDSAKLTADDFVWIGGVKTEDGVLEAAFRENAVFSEGDYIAIAANNKNTVQSEPFYYASDKMIEGVYEILRNKNSTNQQIIDALTNRALALDLTDFNQLTQEEKLSVAGLFKEYYHGDETELEYIFAKAQGAVILSSYTKNGCEMIVKYGGYFDIDEQFINGVKDGYSTKVKELINALTADHAVKYETASKPEANAVSKVETTCILALLSDPDLTWSRMKTYLTETFAEYGIVDGIDLLKDFPSSVYKKMIGKTYKSFEDVRDALANAMRTEGIGNNGNNTGVHRPGGSSGGGSGSGSSGISRPSGIVTQPAGPTIKDSNEQHQEPIVYFKDTADMEWAYGTVCDMAEKGVISYAEAFRPNDQTTRAEFVKMAVQTFGLLDTQAQCSFSDVPADAWEYSYVASAVAAGIVNGVDAFRFDPAQPITRQDMACIVYRILNMGNGSGRQFSDQAQISDYALEAVMAMSGLGVINGYEDETFKPGRFATRAETAVMLNRAMKIERA